MSELLIAGGIGVAFGCALECAGLGDPPKLAGQFYLRDFTVLKVMLSAMLTAVLGVFWGGRLGAFDPAAFYVPDTYLFPQLLGGLVFGFGFALSGLCPGTSCVALASGRIEGAATMLGLFAGVLLVGMAFPAIEPFYRSTAYGPLTLQQLIGLPRGVTVALITVIVVSVSAWIAKRETRR